jgi:hypothetical protein
LVSFKDSARNPRNRMAISALAVAAVVFVAVGIAVEIAFLPKASSPAGGSGQTTTAGSGGCLAATPASGSTPSTPVKTAVDQLVQDFNSRNVAGLSNFYSTDACVTWSGLASGLTGTYNGQGNVRILYGSSIGKTTSLNASIANYNEKAASPAVVNVTMTILMNGNSSVVGALTSTIDATQQWVYNGGQWQIVKENWDYKTFNVQFPVSSTTFPQWGALRTGKNPDLVSEKSFEWNAGPYVAASVYAFLFGIAAIGVIKYRSRSRPG